MRRPLAVLLFFVAVVGFTFATTVVHEVGHAMAWDASERPDVIFAESRDTARDTVASEKRMDIGGQPYRVMEVERTTIALYPKTILITGLTLGIAPGAMLPDQVLASTFYALDEADYERLAAGEEPTGWKEAAMPMIVNGLLVIPIWLWLVLRPNAISMAAAWANAAEWRYNVHHAQEIGMNETLYLAASLVAMAVTAAVVTFYAVSRWHDAEAPTRTPVSAASPQHTATRTTPDALSTRGQSARRRRVVVAPGPTSVPADAGVKRRR